MSADRGQHPATSLRAHGLRPNKALGQNFLLDPGIAARIAEAATPSQGGTVLEIGAGRGALTRPLLCRAAKVLAFERDAKLTALLREQLGPTPGLELVCADALARDWREELRPWPEPHTLAGNLPYVITGPVLERTVALAPHVERAVFMVQREVAARVAAPPGSRTYGALSVFVQAAFAIDRLLTAKPGAFYPAPGVDSTVIVLRALRPPRAVESEAFRTVVRSAFGERRKMLRNTWRALGGWSPAELADHAHACGIDLEARAETLDVEAFARMAARLGSG